jgi:hypothetical protein
MPIVKDTIVYQCDDCKDKFLDEKEVFIIDGQLDFGGASYGVLGEAEIICPMCFLKKMFLETGNMEVVDDILEIHEEGVISEEDEIGGDDFIDWGNSGNIEGLEDDDEVVDIDWGTPVEIDENEIEEEFE